MYAWIWHRLPGRLPVKIVEALLLAAAVVALLWFVLFPLLGPLVPFDDVTVD